MRWVFCVRGEAGRDFVARALWHEAQHKRIEDQVQCNLDEGWLQEAQKEVKDDVGEWRSAFLVAWRGASAVHVLQINLWCLCV